MTIGTATKTSTAILDFDKIVTLLRAGGPIANSLKGFEAREQQKQMLRDVISTYNNGRIALLEASTGTGKSLAYLLPALLFAAKTGKRTVISTGTIALQEQLITKDIPILMKALGLSLKPCLVKGMGNYLCLRKFEELISFRLLLPEQEQKQVETIEEWLPSTNNASRSDLPMHTTHALWTQIAAEQDICNHRRCGHYGRCHFIRARKEAEDAQIIVVNHHLLFADMALRAASNGVSQHAILPPYSHLILDEAHHIEDIATTHFSARVRSKDLYKLLSRLAGDKTGKLVELRKALVPLTINTNGPSLDNVRHALEVDLPLQQKQLFEAIRKGLDQVTPFVVAIERRKKGMRQMRDLPRAAVRLVSGFFQLADWKEKVHPALQQIATGIKNYSNRIQSMLVGLELQDEPKLLKRTDSIRSDIRALSSRLDSYATFIQGFEAASRDSKRVTWAEVPLSDAGGDVALVNTSLSVAQELRDHLYSKLTSVVMCSATLATDKKFSFTCKRLGLLDSSVATRVIQRVYGTPFQYENQALLVVPTDMPPPTAPEFISCSMRCIHFAVQASQGKALVLFTSYKMLTKCYDALYELLAKEGYPVMAQGEASRKDLLTHLRETPASVLFATYAFWEGIDLAGETLRCVIITKLPFRVPTEPLAEARCETLEKEGKSSFWDYSLPLAVIKFKQGFGRLIRTQSDFGCVVCLDPRLVTKPYGQLFLKSLPGYRELFVPIPSLLVGMSAFYRQGPTNINTK